MIRMFVRHNVNDYDAWRKAYDDFSPTRDRMGVVGAEVFRGADNPNEITASHDFGSIEEATAFAASDDLRQAMTKAGVASEPVIWFTTPA